MQLRQYEYLLSRGAIGPASHRHRLDGLSGEQYRELRHPRKGRRRRARRLRAALLRAAAEPPVR